MFAAVMENWSFMRILRLGMGLWLVFESMRMHETMFMLLGGMFAVQAIFNVGCMGGNCGVPASNPTRMAKIEETTFEEIK